MMTDKHINSYTRCEAMHIIKTWVNSWSTTDRYHEAVTLCQEDTFRGQKLTLCLVFFPGIPFKTSFKTCCWILGPIRPGGSGPKQYFPSGICPDKCLYMFEKVAGCWRTNVGKHFGSFGGVQGYSLGIEDAGDDDWDQIY